jgi:hypothetical protein
VSNDRHRHEGTSTDTDGRPFPSQAGRSAGSPHGDLASGRRGQWRCSTKVQQPGCVISEPRWPLLTNRPAETPSLIYQPRVRIEGISKEASHMSVMYQILRNGDSWSEIELVSSKESSSTSPHSVPPLSRVPAT